MATETLEHVQIACPQCLTPNRVPAGRLAEAKAWPTSKCQGVFRCCPVRCH